MAVAVVFDLDGVVYRGSKAIEGVPEEIARLQKKAKVLFLTNNATKSRSEYVVHLSSFGISAKPEEVMTSSYGTALFILEKYGAGKKVFVVGEQGLKDELSMEAKAELSEEAEIVVCGLDRQISYRKLDVALNNLVRGAKFILANNDPTFPSESGVSPGSGAIAASLIYASGRQPDAIIGKPSDFLIRKLLSMHGILPASAAFVGDRLDIDIRMANAVGMESILVLTGIAKESDIEHAPESDKPKIVIPSAAHVGKALGFW